MDVPVLWHVHETLGYQFALSAYIINSKLDSSGTLAQLTAGLTVD